MKISKVKGIVIKETKTGEADKILTLLTTKHGKIQAVAKGARRPQSRLIAGTQFLSFSDFVLFKSRDLYSIRDCNVIESFYDIRNSLDKITYAAHIIDIVNEVSEENLSYYNLIKLLLNTLYVLANTNKSPELITRVFEIKLMSIIGFKPQIAECSSCSNRDDLVFFSSRQGGVICVKCAETESDAIKISSSTVNALRFILNSEINKVFSFEVAPEILKQLSDISKSFVAEHLEKKFEKLEFLNIIKEDTENDY